MPHPTVAPTLDYLKVLVEAGTPPVDIWASAVSPEQNLVRVHLADGSVRHFVILEENQRFMAHYKEAIEFCGFGPKGLSNLIYAETLEFGRAHALKNEEIEVQLSQECADRVGRDIEHYLSYGLMFRVSPKQTGISYAFSHRNTDP